jgi:hypothetical protein
MKNSLLIALTITACTSNMQAAIALTKARTLASTAAAYYTKSSKLKKTGMIIGGFICADIIGHQLYSSASRFKICFKSIQKGREHAYYENQIAWLNIETSMEIAKSRLTYTDRYRQLSAEREELKKRRDAIYAEIEALCDQYNNFPRKQSFTERALRAIAAKIF